ncbi:MAG: four helix bundle protein [Patescibacteria group bacterium]|mgnify:CR=1 FL=1
MTNDQSGKTQIPMTNDQNEKTKAVYNLSERTARFAEQIIDFCKKISCSIVTSPLVNQLVRSGTSIGANYSEADEASSKKDFINKMHIAMKETKETKYWLRIIGYSVVEMKDEAQKLHREAQELNLIFSAIIRKCKQN